MIVFRRWLAELSGAAKRRIFGSECGRVTRQGRISRAKRPNLIFLALSLCFQSIAGQELKQIRRVAVFYELGLSSPAVALEDREIRAALESSQYQIEFYPEFMETTLFDDPAVQRQFREAYIRKYHDRKPDLIIALGPSPLRFMVEAHEKFFTDIPIVFGGTNEQQADYPVLDSHFTGCWANYEPKKTLDVALQLQPGSRHVVVVGGTSRFDKHLEAMFREQLDSYEGNLDFIYLTDLDMPSLLTRLKHLPSHTIVLYTNMGMDAKGVRYVGTSQAGPMIAKTANAPVFGPSDVDLGHGEVGGDLQTTAKEGNTIGQIAVRILNGEQPRDIPIVRGESAFVFDWRALHRWGFRESALPPGSTVLYRPPTFWERSKWGWLTSLVMMLCLSALALFIRLKSAKGRQVALGGMLINAQEKERSRLASEIHDDFSQRLALIALELENAEEAIATSPDEAVRQVHNALNSASEIGADLHTLSHRLHPSTLERLGLVTGVRALCKEFAVQQGIEIDLVINDVPRSVHPDVALCLFRIVQEGLRNQKKHSGVATAKVRLHRIGDKLFVMVSDDGAGFDMYDPGRNEGLGILSMKERADLLGGRFEIHSKPGRGTRIEAWIPLQPRSERLAG